MNNSETTNKNPILYSIVTSILIWGFYMVGLELLDLIFFWLVEAIVDFIVFHGIISSIVLGGIYYLITKNVHNTYSSSNILIFLLLSVVSSTIIGIALLMFVQGDDVFAIVFTFPRILIVLFSIYIFMIIEFNMRSNE